MAKVQIKAQIVLPLCDRIKLSAVGVKACSRTVEPVSSGDLFREFSKYKTWLIETHGVTVDPVVPNLYSMFWNSRKTQKRVLIPTPKKIAGIITKLPIDATYCTICGRPFEPDSVRDESMVCHMQCAHPPFETNMMEPLVGWKGWTIKEESGKTYLITNGDFPWTPDQAAEASCSKHCNDDGAPGDTCACGIYAADDRGGAHGGVQGEIYGWGRYVRADLGWRAQYAYPKNFHIMDHQMKYFDFLKTFHVPIFIMQPFKIYNPNDEGYEAYDDSYRRDEENRDSGTGEESGPTED